VVALAVFWIDSDQRRAFYPVLYHHTEGKLEASRRDAEAKVIMANATKEAIQRVSDAIGDRHLPAIYLLGERYVDAFKSLAASPNAKPS